MQVKQQTKTVEEQKTEPADSYNNWHTKQRDFCRTLFLQAEN